MLEKFLLYQDYLMDGMTIEQATKHLFMVKYLDADAVWLCPIQASPGYDHGYDVSDYKAVNPKFGTMEELDNYIEEAHALGIKVIIDLVLNHTSTEHEWFKTHPEYYYWEDQDRPGWCNLFNHGPAWKYDETRGKYYLHLFHEKQADLRWFIGDRPNRALIQEFRDIVDFWTVGHHVDGFRLDVPQAINKNFSNDKLEFSDLLFGERAVEVINEIFFVNAPLLIMECFDPNFGSLAKHYAESTPIDYIMNILVKDAIESGEFKFSDIIQSSTKCRQFMLDFESHDAPRFPSRPGMTPEEAIWRLFNSGANAVCLYQGEELGLGNPSKDELPDELMLELDAQTAMRYAHGESLDDLRPRSRANARIPIPIEEYRKQLGMPGSYLSLTKAWIERWRHSKQV